MPKAKRVSKGNIGERFFLKVEGSSGNGTSCVLLELEGTGNDAVATFSDSHFPGGEWGKWKARRFNSKWYTDRGAHVTIIE
jgi:hypothetical protein